MLQGFYLLLFPHLGWSLGWSCLLREGEQGTQRNTALCMALTASTLVPRNCRSSREPILAHGSQSSLSGKWVSLAGVVETKMTCKIPITASAISTCLAPCIQLAWGSCSLWCYFSGGVFLVPRKHLDTSTLIRAVPPQQREGFVPRKTKVVGVKSVRGSREAAYCLPPAPRQ